MTAALLVATAGHLRGSRPIRTIASVAFAAISLGLVVRFVLGQAPAARFNPYELSPRYVLLALVLTIFSSVGGGFAWKLILDVCGAKLTVAEVLSVWYLSIPAKYGLGALTQYVGRVYLAERLGVTRKAVVASFGVEMLVILVSGLSMLLLLAPIGGAAAMPTFPPPLLVLGPLVAVAVSFGFLPALSRVGGLLPAKLLGLDGLEVLGQVRSPVFVLCLNWCLLGGATFALANAIHPIEARFFPFFVFAMTLAMLSGLLAPTPLGLGVREAVLTFLLASTMPAQDVLAMAVIQRVMSAAVELAGAGVGLGYNLHLANGHRSKGLPDDGSPTFTVSTAGCAPADGSRLSDGQDLSD